MDALTVVVLVSVVVLVGAVFVILISAFLALMDDFGAGGRMPNPYEDEDEDEDEDSGGGTPFSDPRYGR